MNKKTVKDIAFTTALAFLIISFVFIGLFALIDDNQVKFERFVFFRYILGKLFSIFLFSLSLGFINRIPETKKMSAGIKRILHFVLSSVSFIVFIGVIFNIIYGLEAFDIKKTVVMYIAFLFGYIISIGISSLYRKINNKNTEELSDGR